MKLNNISMLDIIPPYMQEDTTVIGLCAAANHIFKRLFEAIQKIDFYQNLNLLNEADLDYIAKIRNIIWYDKSSTKDVKISVIKNAEKVFWSLGTVSAVESVVEDIIGECDIMEWFQYGGDPYHFKIVTDNPLISGDAVSTFNSIIQHVKRKSAILDGVEISLAASMIFNLGAVLHTGELLELRQEG